MRNTLSLLALPFLFVMATHAQVLPEKAAGDTANYPYWIEMMQDPDANFFATQRAFESYWKDRPHGRGKGWKVFKRWEYMMQSRVSPDGKKPAPDKTYNAYSDFVKSIRSSSGNWTNLGPATIPAPGPAGYEGLGRLNVVAWHPSDPNKLYVGAPSGGFWMSSDGGNTWTTSTDTMPTLGVSAIVVDFSNPNHILIGTGDRDAGDAPGLGVFKSTDGGLTWAPSSGGMGNRTVARIIQHPTSAQTYLAATSGGVYRTTDGGVTWSLSTGGNFKDIHFKPNDPNIVYAVGIADFYRSTNNGTSFTKITAGLTGGQRGVIAVTAANPDYVYFMQSDGSSGFKGLYRSTDAGLTFTTRSTGPNIMGWSCDGSDSGGQGWYDLALAADPLNPEIIYAGGVNVWKSLNGGTSWIINSHWYGGCSVPAVHADCHFLGYSPVDGKLYAGNDGGCWVTSDGGTTWTDRTVGMTIGQIYKLGQAATVKNKVINGFQDNGTYTLLPSGWVATGGGDGMECAVDYENPIFTYHTIYYGDIYRRNNNAGEVHIAGENTNGITEGGAWVTPFTLSRADRKGMFVGYKNIWRSTNVTSSPVVWTKISNNLGGSNNSNMAVVEHSAANTNIFYAARSDNKFFRSDNVLASSPSWYDLSGMLPVAGNTPTDIESHPVNPDIVYITHANGVYKSADRGVTWTNITGNLPAISKNCIAFYRNAPEGLYVGTDAGVYYRDATTNGWIPFNDGMPASARVTELEIYYDNDSVSEDAIRASTYGRGLWSSDMYHGTPEADFTTSNTTVPAGCAVAFTDLSTGVPTHFQWSFPGASPATSSLKNPVDIVYSTPGTYTVSLKVWNESGSDSITKTNFITVSGTLLPVVDFTADQHVLCNSNTVKFTDLSTNCPDSWQWSITPNTATFVSGTSASSQNPVVWFANPGYYDVQLTVSNGVGNSTLVRTGYIVMDGYSLPFIENFENGIKTRHWQVVNPDLQITWDTITVGGMAPGARAVYMDFFNYMVVNRRDQLISPPVNLTGYTAATLSFRHAYEQRVRKDSLIIFVSDDCGLNWERIWAMGPDGSPNLFVTHPPTNNAFFPQTSDDWCGGSYGTACYSIDLTPWAGREHVMVMFEAYNRYGNNLFLNDIRISGPVGIPENGLKSSGLTVQPNPTDGIFTARLEGWEGTARVTVSTVHGVQVADLPVRIHGNSGSAEIDLGGLPAGVYLVQASGSSATRTARIIKR